MDLVEDVMAGIISQKRRLKGCLLKMQISKERKLEIRSPSLFRREIHCKKSPHIKSKQ
jgi:hypothetical protein